MRKSGAISSLRNGLKVGNNKDPWKYGNFPERKALIYPHHLQKGHRLAARENMSEESHRRRMEGLKKTWIVQERKRRGERIMTTEMKQDIGRRIRARLNENIRAEARDIQNMCRAYALEGVERVIEMMREANKPSDVLAAVNLLLERGYGKASQTNVNATIDANGKPTEITAKELHERIAETLQRVEAITNGAQQAGESEAGPADVRNSDRDPGNSSLH